MGCAAEVISLDDGRASQQRQALRQQLHEHFDRWLDELETQLPEPEATLAQVSETIWTLRQSLTAGVAQTIVEQTHRVEREQQGLRCATCDRLLKARPAVSRTARTLVGDVEIERPYFYCRSCHLGRYPLDAVLGLSSGQIQVDVQQAAIDLATEVSSETASSLFGRLSGIEVSSERLHTFTNQAAEGLSVLDVAPSRVEIDNAWPRWLAVAFAAPSWFWGLMAPMSHRVPSMREDVAQVKRATGRVERGGDMSGTRPKGFDSTCSTAIASFICLAGIRSKAKTSWEKR